MGYTQWAAFAERVAAPAQLLWPVPQGWSAEEGAAFPVNYFTAYLAYWKAGLLAPAKKASRVLIHAVAGGVGTAAVQIGKLLGAEMYGTSSSDDKLARVAELGLQHGINYKQRDYEEAIRDLTHGEGVDAVFEMLGGEHTNKSARCLRDFGRVIVYGSATGEKSLLDTRLLYAKGASVHGLWLTYLSAHRELMSEAWKQLSAWTSQGAFASRDRASVSYGASRQRVPLTRRRKKLRQSGFENPIIVAVRPLSACERHISPAVTPVPP